MNTKAETINRILEPTNLQELQVFLWIMWHCLWFINEFVQLNESLVRLLQGVSFEWGLTQQESLKDLKGTLQESPILAYPGFEKEFFIYTDASNLAVGAILDYLDQNSRIITLHLPW